jgi:hypothetical protein
MQARELLLRDLKPSHPKVRAFDDSMASLVWLVAVTRPITEGEQKGRLPVPKDMLGPAASDILVAFDLAGADVTATASLYRRLLADVFHSERSWSVMFADPQCPEDEIALFDEARNLSQVLSVLQQRISQTDGELRAALERYSEAEKSVVEPLRRRQAELVMELRGIHEACDVCLTKAMSAYVKALRTQRPTNVRMTTFRQSLLLPLYVMTTVTSCRDWELPIEQLETWRRIVSQEAATAAQLVGQVALTLNSATLLSTTTAEVSPV